MVRLKNRRGISSCQIKTIPKKKFGKDSLQETKAGWIKRRVWEVYIMANLTYCAISNKTFKNL